MKRPRTRGRGRLSYANVTATLALFAALGGSSYAVIEVDSGDVVDNSIRSRDVRNNTVRSQDVREQGIRPRDIRRNSLGAGVVKESALGRVRRAGDAERLGGAPAQDFRLRCPADTVAMTGVCIETTERALTSFFAAVSVCDQQERGLPTMPQLLRFAETSGPLPQAEWTASVYRNTANGPLPAEQAETVLLSGSGDPGFERVYLAVQHAFRCVALPTN